MSAPTKRPNIADGPEQFEFDIAALHDFELGELWDALQAFFASRLLSRSATSTSSNSITTGNKTFDVGANKGFQTGNFLIAAATASPGNYVQGQCLTYNITTGILVMTNTDREGTGTHTAWTITEALAGNSATLDSNTFSGVQNFAQGADIASASTINLTAATGNVINITGVVPVNAVTLGNGQFRWCRAAAALPLNYHATNNRINTGGQNIVLAADDWILYRARNGVIHGTIYKDNGKAVVETPQQVIEAPLTVAALRKKSQSDMAYISNMVLMSNGRLKAWGRSGAFTLGLGLTVDVATYPQMSVFSPAIPDGETVIDFVFEGCGAFAVLSNGWVYSCGITGTGYDNLGHGVSANKYVFTRIEYFVTNTLTIVKVFANSQRVTISASAAYFLTDAGSLYSCGYNGAGQLGIGSTTDALTPQLISGAITNIVDVFCEGSAYQNNAFILTATGLLYGVGYNSVGQLGLGDLVQRTAFTNTGLANVTKVSKTQGWHTTVSPYTPANGHTLALLSNGQVWATGYNGYGQLGMGNTTDRNTFAQITALSNVVDIGACGGKYGYSWALTSLGELWTWGYNANGQLGQNSLANVLTPTKLIAWSGVGTPPWDDKIVKVHSLHCGAGNTGLVILDSDGKLYYAGYDYVGFTGTVGNTTRFTPIQMAPMQRSDEKIVDFDILGIDSTFVITALSNYGNLYACGTYLYYVTSGGLYTGYSYDQRSLQKVPNICGYE